MSLARATVPLAGAPALPPGPPFAAEALLDWVGVEFDLPPRDPRLRGLNAGGREPVAALANLAGYVDGWAEYADYVDTLEPSSPVHDKKMLERALTLHRWRALGGLGGVEASKPLRVLDIGCGVGRFARWFLDLGHDVTLVDGDLRSLRHAVWHCAGAPGRLDVHWTTAEDLPPVDEIGRYDIVVMAEILNYVERPADVVAAVAERLTEDGVVLFSVEARYGWALATDVAPGLAEGFFDGVAHRAGDRYVRCYSDLDLETLFAGFDVRLQRSHYVLSGPFELAVGADIAHGGGRGDPEALAQLLAWEERFEAHPVSRELNRAWVGVAKPK